MNLSLCCHLESQTTLIYDKVYMKFELFLINQMAAQAGVK